MIQPAMLVDTIANQFYIPNGIYLEYRVAIQVMMLPNHLFQQLFVQISMELKSTPTELIKIFFDKIAMKHLVVTCSYVNISLKLDEKQPKFKQSTPRAQSASSLDFQSRFGAALTIALTQAQQKTVSFQNNAQLCKAVNHHFLLYGQVDFWKKVSRLITDKNEQQLKDYYQKSFLRLMFQECISETDKILLCQLISQMDDQKPSIIANRFLEEVGTDKYFKRNIVMYIVNRKLK
ncbi:Hypothetical_protein [Hexamita inflata]|uniref:Hypothetical_protein n=1 Tax=Hexamita inflata TaxID=28002 RepID=A0ABP1GGN1_9EUKA